MWNTTVLSTFFYLAPLKTLSTAAWILDDTSASLATFKLKRTVRNRLMSEPVQTEWATLRSTTDPNRCLAGSNISLISSSTESLTGPGENDWKWFYVCFVLERLENKAPTFIGHEFFDFTVNIGHKKLVYFQRWDVMSQKDLAQSDDVIRTRQ